MEKSERITDIYASMVFSEDVMRERLPKEVYKSLINTIANGNEIDAGIADEIVPLEEIAARITYHVK